MIDLSQIYKKDASLPWRRFGEQAVIVNKNPEIVHVANDVGIRVWELLDGKSTLEAIIQQMAREYEASLEQISGDVCELITELENQRLIQNVLMAS
jgi:hypothetical protein